MYINEIDNIIDEVYNNFFIFIRDNEIFKKILDESNFVIYIKEINELIFGFFDNYDFTKIKTSSKNNETEYVIMMTLKRYIAFYIFLFISYNYKKETNLYINNVIEISKNQYNDEHKIERFYNTESNSLIIKYSDLILKIKTLVSTNNIKTYINKKEYDKGINFLNDLGLEFIETNFKIKDEFLRCHNIIKTVLVIVLYKNEEKVNFFKLLELSENNTCEYMFLEIFVQKVKQIDFSTIERALMENDNYKNKNKNNTLDFWKFLTDIDKELFKKKDKDYINKKINTLVKSKIIHLISDEFLLYHKDNERYENTKEENIKTKRRDNTKNKYIINKIETGSNLYSKDIIKNQKSLNDIKKLFHQSYNNIKAILINVIEDIKIINKFLHQGKLSIENNEFLNEILSYTHSPFVNFKEFEKCGFQLTLNKTTDLFRYVSFETVGEFKQNKKDKLQIKTCGENTNVNIVGIFIPTNTKSSKCIRTRDTLNIRENESSNCYDIILRYIKETCMGLMKTPVSIYWIFKESDLLLNNFKENIDSSVQEKIKFMISDLYDKILIFIYNKILYKLKTVDKLTPQKGYIILKYYEKIFFKISRKSDIYNKIIKNIYLNIKDIDNVEDDRDNKIYGLDENTFIKLPEYNYFDEKDLINVVNFSLIKKEIKSKSKNIKFNEGFCQHNISWDDVISIKKSDQKLYTEKLYEFVQQYAIENEEGEFICKSCGIYIDIKKYISASIYDVSKKKLIVEFSVEGFLEDLKGYENFRTIIISCDKLIEKIALLNNIPHLTNVSEMKWKKKLLIKETIDVINLNNTLLKHNFDKRNINSIKSYNIPKGVSQFFIFNLENSIYIYSSKDKDFYKKIKQNNVLSYLIFLILLEINDNHITLLGNDIKGICNFKIFYQVYNTLFKNIKIIINDIGGLEYILKYKILCYIIYVISCQCIKYRVWFYDENIDKKEIPSIHKTFIFTIIDVINSILEFAVQKNKNSIYEILSVKFFSKLMTTYSNEEMFNTLIEINSEVNVKKSKEEIKKIPLYNLKGVYSEQKYLETIRRVLPFKILKILPKVKINYKYYYDINNLTNCDNGEFHDWNSVNGKLECNRCKINNLINNFNEDKSKKIYKEFINSRLIEKGGKFCMVDGLFHKYALKEDNLVCIKCNKPDNYKYSYDELIKLDDLIKKNNEIENVLKEEKLKKIEIEELEKENFNIKLIDDIKNSYDKENNFINNFIQLIKTNLGSNKYLDNNLTTNLYVFDHNYIGNILENKLILNESDILIKKKHNFFNTDVIYYKHKKGGTIEVFYDMITENLLGYREESKDYIFNKISKKIIIKYSLENKIKMLGYTSRYFNIEKEYYKFSGIKVNYKNISDTNKIMLINKINKDRFINIKRIFIDFNSIFNKLINSVIKPEFNPEDINSINILIEKFFKKFENIILNDKDKKNKIFENWKNIDNSITFVRKKTFKRELLDNLYIYCGDIVEFEESGNLILFYFIKELEKLIKYNNNYLNVNLSNFICEYIDCYYNIFNIEEKFENIDIKRFILILENNTYVREVKQDLNDNVYEYDKEITKEESDEIDDLEEEQEALDVDTKLLFSDNDN